MTKPTNPQRSPEVFLAAKADFDVLLADLQQMTDDHFGANPDAVLWVDSEELKRRNAPLRHITDVYFRRGEYTE